MGKLFTRTGLVFLGAGILGFTACSPNTSIPPPPEPSISAPSAAVNSGSPLETPTPDETPTVKTVRPDINIPEPSMPPNMANDDLDGADAAARYFLDLYGYVYNTGDLKAWKELSDPECVRCTSVAEQVSKHYEQGHWYENVAMLHGDSTLYYPDEEFPFYLVVLEVKSPQYKYFDSTGQETYSSDEVIIPEYAIGVEYRGPYKWSVVGATATNQEDTNDRD